MVMRIISLQIQYSMRWIIEHEGIISKQQIYCTLNYYCPISIQLTRAFIAIQIQYNIIADDCVPCSRIYLNSTLARNNRNRNGRLFADDDDGPPDRLKHVDVLCRVLAVRTVL